ncbi:hypothetical protein ABIE26_002937 [Pedobacter africanus]|uniref:hypothetical protein n=1 Tax=Pedobacter africanus TaxID=151894 RepID=UPI0033958EC0
MDRNEKVKLLLKRWKGDPRLRVYHMVILMAILNLWVAGSSPGAISISRRSMLEVTRIGGIGTYHRYMKDLRVFGYIEYTPSYHPRFGSKVALVV